MSKTEILVVEDESIVAMDIKTRLEGLGYIVTAIATTGEDSIQEVTRNPPDLVLMDIVLKGEMDGIDAAQVIRDNFNIPVLYVTAYSDEKTLERAKITGPFGYIIKPFEDRELHSAIEVALYKHKMDTKLKESEEWLSTMLRSIGDAVIATDKKGHVTFMNPIAEKITEWEQNEARGSILKDVFKIVDEKTGNPIEDPVSRVLQENAITGLEDPTILITRKGANIPIDDSIAPIKDDKGDIIGIALVFRDITERRKSEKEKELLLKEKARGELLSFVVSALPVFASNIPPRVRNTIAKSFADRLQNNVKPRFEETMFKCLENSKETDNQNNKFNCYVSWLSEFFSNLDIDTEIRSEGNKRYFKFLNCPWMDEVSFSPMFCLICRAIIIRSFTWSSIRGNAEQTTCMAEGSDGCTFEFAFTLKD